LDRIALGHYALGVPVSDFVDLFLRQVSKGMACAGDQLERGVYKDGPTPRGYERGLGGRPEPVQFFPDADKVGLTFLVRLVW
jgi:hypothetical protein